MAVKKRGKTNTKRRAATRRGKQKPLPTWVMLGAGLLAGVILVLLVQLVINRTGQPNSGIRNLIDAAKQSSKSQSRKPATKIEKHKTVKPQFNFYTILPEIETVITESEARKLPPEKAVKNVSYVLQAGSFTRYQDADRLKARLVLNGLSANIQKVTIEGKGQFHRVRLGPFETISGLDNTNKKLKQLGIQAYLLKVEQNR
jgi:cell division protein FtsN